MFTERQLFGGAITCDIPTAWRDVSDVRQVPDHQEVWQEMGGAVLVVEILQRQEVDDAQAAQFFFSDLAESNGITSSSDSQFRPAPSAIAATIEGAVPCAGLGFQKIKLGRDHDISGRPRENQPIEWTSIELCALRLPRVDTDLLVTITKAMPNPNEPPPSSTVAWSPTFQRVLESLKIQDWSLFG